MADPAYIRFSLNNAFIPGPLSVCGEENLCDIHEFDHWISGSEPNDPWARTRWDCRHHTVKVTLEIGSYLPQLYAVDVSNCEYINKVEIFWQKYSEKQQKNIFYFKHAIYPVKITSISTSMPDVLDQTKERYNHLVSLEFRYRWIEHVFTEGNLAVKNEWKHFFADDSLSDIPEVFLTGRSLSDEALEWLENQVPEEPEEEVVEEVKEARRTRLVGMLFDANKCFLLPQGLPGIKTIIGMHKKDPEAEVLIVGHAGSDEDLAGADIAFDRAQILGAYLKSIPSIWLNWFGPDKSARARWGTREIQLMMSVLPEGKKPLYEGYASGITDDKTTAAIKNFQEFANKEKGLSLPLSGKADFETRKALVEAYMGISDTTLAESVIPVAHGCEGHFEDTATASGNVADDRRLEVFFFKEGIEPRPADKVSSAGSASYPAWLELLVETKDFECHGIHVQIIDNKKQPAPFATVNLAGPVNAKATSDEHGFVSFFKLKPGDYRISSEMNGYKIGVSQFTYPTSKTVSGYAKKEPAKAA